MSKTKSVVGVELSELEQAEIQHKAIQRELLALAKKCKVIHDQHNAAKLKFSELCQAARVAEWGDIVEATRQSLAVKQEIEVLRQAVAYGEERVDRVRRKSGNLMSKITSLKQKDNGFLENKIMWY